MTGAAYGEATITVTTEDGGLRKLFPDGTVETATEAVAPEAEAVAPEASKTVIGIVFHAGRHATDASDYTSPLTAGGPTLAGEVRGYAVAITDATLGTSNGAKWVTGPNEEYDFRSGVSTDKYAWTCETYGNRTLDYEGNPTSDYEWQAPLKAPAGTSGWFLPSIGQLYYMATCRDYLDSRFMAAKEVSAAELQEYVKEFFSQSYWSSTKDGYYSAQAMVVDFENRDRYGTTRNNKYLVSRAVIVF